MKREHLCFAKKKYDFFFEIKNKNSYIKLIHVLGILSEQTKY